MDDRRSCLTVLGPAWDEAAARDELCGTGDPQVATAGFVGSGCAILGGVTLGFLCDDDDDDDEDAAGSSMRRRLFDGGCGLAEREAGGEGGKSDGSGRGIPSSR